MRWLNYLLLSLPVVALGLLAAGFIGRAGVRWHRLSSHELKSGLIVVVWAILGVLVPLGVSLVTFGVMKPQDGPEYLRTLGIAVGVLAVIGGAVAAGTWWASDPEPRLDGRPLMLEVELRLPVTFKDPPASDDARLMLNSLSGNRTRDHHEGTLHVAKARQEVGRWIIPGEVAVFTMRGKRAIEARIAGMESMDFVVSLPARPGREYLEWSGWLPKPSSPEVPWPDTKASYRFRVQKVPLPPPEMTVEDLEAEREAGEIARFQLIPDDAPLPEWFPHLRYGVPAERRALATARMMKKPSFQQELRELMLGPETNLASEAMHVVAQLPEFSPGLKESIHAAGADIAERIRKGNQIPLEADPDFAWAGDISRRFGGWQDAVRTLRERTQEDYTPELKLILELARVRPESLAMRNDVCRIASYYMKEWAGLEPLPTDPKLR